MNKQLVIAICAFGLVTAGLQFASAATFVEEYLDGGSWNAIYAQGFSPGVSPTPDLGLAPGSIATLESFEFYKSGNADSTADLKLAIISPFFSNIKTFESTSSFVVGLSDNTIAGTAGIAVNDPIAFSFSGLDLTVGQSYGAVFVSQSGTTLTPELVPALVADYVETAPGSGVYVPETNYGTNTQFDYAVSNFINETIVDAYFATFSEAADASFKATFSVVPEPSTLLLGLSAIAYGLGRRSRYSA